MSAITKKKRARRRNYSEAFKREAVSTYEASGKSYAEICRLLDITYGSLLRDWCVLYGSNKKALRKEAPMTSDNIFTPAPHSPENSADKERISSLEAEVKQLRHALGNQAAKDYLAGLREESWREICPSGSAKKVDQLVSKKL